MSEKEQTLDKELNRLYELAFHIIPSLGEDGANAKFEEVKKLVESKATKVVSESAPALLKLKYTISKTVESRKQKNNTAYFAWIKFEALSDEIENLKEELDLKAEIMRYMIVKTERDTNISSEEVARFLSGSSAKSDTPEEVDGDDDSKEKEEVESDESNEEEVTESTEDEIDEAIDELVGEEEK